MVSFNLRSIVNPIGLTSLLVSSLIGNVALSESSAGASSSLEVTAEISVDIEEPNNVRQGSDSESEWICER